MESKLHTAFNPLIEIDDDAHLATAYLIINGDEANKITIKSEMFNYEARIDIAKYMRHCFVQEPIDNNRFINLNKLFELKWELRDRYNEYRAGGRLINAVAQIGDNPDLTAQQGTFRTEFKRLRQYVGYELTVGCIGYEGSTNSGSTYFGVQYRGSGGYSTYSPFSDVRFHFLYNNAYLSGIVGISIASKQADIGKVAMPIEYPNCIPNNPFYVRWVNQMGGYDYWMFSGRQKYESKAENKKYFNPYIEDTVNANSVREMYAMDCKESVVVGSENVNDDDFLPLRKIVYSPLIEWWDEKRGKWIRLLVSDFDSAYDTRKNSHKIEVTFELPDIQLQF